MNTYSRTGRMGAEKETKEAPVPQAAPQEEKGVFLNGYHQVLEMLRAADPEFRKSLLARLSQRDPRLVRELKQDLDL